MPGQEGAAPENSSQLAEVKALQSAGLWAGITLSLKRRNDNMNEE